MICTLYLVLLATPRCCRWSYLRDSLVSNCNSMRYQLSGKPREKHPNSSTISKLVFVLFGQLPRSQLLISLLLGKTTPFNLRVFIKLFALVNAFGNQTKDVNDAQWPLMIISDLFDLFILFHVVCSIYIIPCCMFHLLVSKLLLNKVHCDIHGPGHLEVK